MATVVDAGANKIKLNNGQVVVANKGGWYDGQQYWGGTLSAPGVINALSDQIGAGQRVSNEVIAQTNPANVSYVASQQSTYKPTAGSQPLPAPGQRVTPTGQLTTTQVQSQLNDFGSSLFNSANAAPSRVQTVEEIAKSLKDSGILPSGQAPTPPNLTQTYQNLAAEKGVDRIQADINNLKAQQDEIAAQLRINTAAERGKPVAQNVIEGRISQETRNSQEQYDFIGRQLSRKTDEMTAALGSIQMIMQFTQQDYQNASTSYNQQFDQAISTFNLIRGIQQDQKDEAQKATDNARANLQIMTNAITNGNLDINNLSPDQQAMINKLEVQSGLPIGFTQSIKQKLDPKANIVATTSDNGVIQVLVKNEDGTMSLQSYGSPSGGSGGGASGGSGSSLTSAQQRQVVGAAATALGKVDNNKDKKVSLDEYKNALQMVVASTGVDKGTADDYLTTQMNSLGYKKWNW